MSVFWDDQNTCCQMGVFWDDQNTPTAVVSARRNLKNYAVTCCHLRRTLNNFGRTSNGGPQTGDFKRWLLLSLFHLQSVLVIPVHFLNPVPLFHLYHQVYWLSQRTSHSSKSLPWTREYKA